MGEVLLGARAASGAGLASAREGTAARIALAPYAEPIPSAVKQMIDDLRLLPALVVGRRGDVLEWNEAAEAVYRCHLIPPLQRNTYLFAFTRPEVRKMIVNWEDQARRRVRELKEALNNHPTLARPVPGETFSVYLTASQEAISAVLMVEREKKQLHIYFVSRALQGPELNYPMLEKLILALIYAAMRL